METEQGIKLSVLARRMHVHINPLKSYMAEIVQWPGIASSDIVPTFMAESVKHAYQPVVNIPPMPEFFVIN